MPGIQHLSEIYKKKGRDFIQSLFDKYVIVNEKLDGSSFNVEKDPETGKLKFYKRNSEMPISLVDRTLMRYYEQPIQYFKGLSTEVVASMPKGWRFGMEYFVDEHPQEISYDRVPKNHLVLSYIHVKNNRGELVRTIQDKVELDKWADAIDIERSPIIFSGFLKPDQKLKIMDFVDTPHMELEKKFKTKSFVKYVISILNPKLKKTTLNDDLDKSIEGIVFRFGGDDDKEVFLAKMVDPVFEDMAKQRTRVKTDEADSNDIYNLTLLDILNFLETLNLKKYKPKGKSFEERYVNFINQAFNAFIDEFGDRYEDLDFREPKYLKKKAFDLNTDLIDNERTLELISRNSAFKNLYKIMLAGFRKHKRRPNSIMSTDVIKQFNLTVNAIRNHLSQGLVNENETPTFIEFLSSKGVDVEQEPEHVGGFRDDVSKIISDQPEKEAQKKVKKDDEDKNKKKEDLSEEVPKKPGSKKVNIIVGRFQPFHNGHMTVARDLFEMNKKPCVIVAVHPGNNKSGKSPFEPGTVKSMLSNVPQDSDGAVVDYCMVERGFIADVISALRKKGYEPVLWGAGADRVDDYKKQVEFNAKNSNELNLSDDFQVIKTERHGSGTEVRQAIEDDQFGKFKALVPKSVQGMYHILRKDMERAKQKQDDKARETK